MEAFNEMLGNHNICVRHDPRLRKESIGGLPAHHHTVHSGADLASCHLCAQSRSKKGRRQSRTPRFKQRPGEQTVFSVGRFRVTHTDKKPQGGSNPLVASSDQLNQSQDSEERKDGGYNLRNMFKDVQRPSESPNGVAPNVGKRKKSVTIFGLRRGSDPVGVKAGEGTGKEAGGGVRFAIQSQPVVMEEPIQSENNKPSPQFGSKSGSRADSVPASPQRGTTTSSSENSGPKEGAKLEDRHESRAEITVKAIPGGTPSSLPIPPEKKIDTDEKVLKTEEVFDPGPVQTSTPITPMPGSVPGLPLVIPAGQPEAYSSRGLPVTQTPPDLSSSSELEPGFGGSLALISLGSSPPSSFPVKNDSSISSLKSPITPIEITPSPKTGSRNVSSDAAEAHTPSPKLPPGREMSSQFSASLSQRDLQGAMVPKTEIKRPGILKKTKLSPVSAGDSKVSDLLSSSDRFFEDKLSSLPLSPSSPLSPTSPQGSRISSVVIVKPSLDSKREFSVATMVEEKESPTSEKDKKADTSEVQMESEQGDSRQTESQRLESSGSEVRPIERESRERDDMVEMEDIRDCLVMQMESEPHTLSEQD
ncbi:RELT-like protein 2 isoform 2-T6 [Pholidichthys leucotaenia]